MNFYFYLTRILFLTFIFLLAGCTTVGLSGAFGTSAPSESFAALPNTMTPEQARFVSADSDPDPRILADMRALGAQQANDVYLSGSRIY